MGSWAAIGFATHQAMTIPMRQMVVQTQSMEKVEELIGYAKQLYDSQPQWLKDTYPLSRPLRDFSVDELEWKTGGAIKAIPSSDPGKIRTYHPWGLISDESAHQPQFGENRQAALPACRFILMLSSAGPGDYAEFVGLKPPPLENGIQVNTNERKVPVFWLSYSADPMKNADWEVSERPKYSPAMWEQEMGMDCWAGGGERVLKWLFDRCQGNSDPEKRVVIRDPNWRPPKHGVWGASLDYGKVNPTSLHLYFFDGITKYAVSEYYVGGLTPEGHSKAIFEMRVPIEGNPKLTDLVPYIWADPMIFPESEAGSGSGFVGISTLFVNPADGKALPLIPALRGHGHIALEKTQEMWQSEKPRFRVWCPEPLVWDRKQEGVYQRGCPNLLWELSNLRRRELSPTMQQKKNDVEDLVQKHNHAWDDWKMYLNSETRLPVESKDSLWLKRVETIKLRYPRVTRMGLNQQWRKFEAEQAQGDMVSYR